VGQGIMLFHRSRQISLRRTVLLLADVISIATAIILSSMIRLGPAHGWEYVIEHIPSLGGSCAILLVVFYAAGMYERATLTRKGPSYLLPLVAVLTGLVLIIVVFYARFQLHIGRGILTLAGLFIFFSVWLVRHGYHTAVNYGFLSRNTLIVGDGREADDAIHLIAGTHDSGLRVLGLVSCSRTAPGDFVAGVPVVGTIEKLRELADAFSTETIIVATSLSREHSVLRALRPLRCAGVEVMDYVALHEELAQEITLDHINDEWLMYAAMNSSVIHIRKVKRIMDFAVAIVGLALSSLICAAAALLVKVDSPGPVLYRQRRMGLDGRVYTLLKLRTMKQDAEAGSGAVWSERYDSRVTRVGRVLRKWRIDEIPQLVNVLRGEMSLVGPRPERPEFVETLAKAIPFYKERLLVPPGITGWAQVKFPYAASIDAARRKLQYDLYYIKHMSFFLDVLILLRTFKTIVVGLRHSAEEEEANERSADAVLTVISGKGTPPAPRDKVDDAKTKADDDKSARSA
jgi:exopolysaccharide biosynthesis polyprenyl glycosylphosphotransferase